MRRLGVAIAIVGAVLVGWFIRQPASPTLPPADQARYYSNAKLGFSIKYPASLDSVSQSEGSVSFRPSNAEDLSGFGVQATSTDASSTSEWLREQPVGDPHQAGYLPIMTLGQMTIVSQYVIVDYDGGRPLYGKRVLAIAVGHGLLYQMPLSREIQPEEVPDLDPTLAAVVSSFEFTHN